MPRRMASCLSSSTKACPVETRQVMREDIREEEQGKEMQGELPAWVEVNMKGWN